MAKPLLFFVWIRELVKKARRQYTETGEIDAELRAEIGSHMITEETYAKIVNGNV